ncbi:fructose 1,6-bisphosphatase II [Glycocaulis alkaliphilus]|uniref:Fructose-1,6-bisphosphatase n=1 Tax=Glycocaulis alkaliphilus TaxID=1434191 RepID=A0A3T0EB10_9PROT|nr:class II fructose-bisphosphatase [Glycocaulis alkaliphilus]AZU04346.1 fructose 1,6-bisphosphatase II [Glycocaulis alkaliphilus]GGB77684.1 fructose-1,6-bisphosphatase [Glycocaulis alkaliphilus]
MTSSSLSNLALGAVEAAERAAIAAARLAGHGDKIAADQAAVDAMRKAFNDMPMRGRIVIGEGERDEAPMLYIGEEVGTGEGPEIDIALDPLEGTSLTAGGKPEALTLLALAPRGGLLHAPDTYMDKIAVGPGLPAGVISLDKPVGENVAAVAKAKGVPVSDITVCVLERERHQSIIDGVRAAGARVVLIPDGDVAAVIAAADPARPVDMYVGQGGAPEGVLSAAALRCLGGQIECRLFFRNDDERARAAKTGIKDLDRKYSGAELASKDCLFVASGVTGGQLLEAVTNGPGTVTTQTLLLSSAPRSRRIITTQRFVEGS